MTTNFRALCAELVDELVAWQQADDLYSDGGTTGHSVDIENGESPLEAFKRYGSAEDRYKNHGIKNRNFSNIQVISPYC